MARPVALGSLARDDNEIRPRVINSLLLKSAFVEEYVNHVCGFQCPSIFDLVLMKQFSKTWVLPSRLGVEYVLADHAATATMLLYCICLSYCDSHARSYPAYHLDCSIFPIFYRFHGPQMP